MERKLGKNEYIRRLVTPTHVLACAAFVLLLSALTVRDFSPGELETTRQRSSSSETRRWIKAAQSAIQAQQLDRKLSEIRRKLSDIRRMENSLKSEDRQSLSMQRFSYHDAVKHLNARLTARLSSFKNATGATGTGNATNATGNATNATSPSRDEPVKWLSIFDRWYAPDKRAGENLKTENPSYEYVEKGYVTTGRRYDASVNQLMFTECKRKCQPQPGYNPSKDLVISCIKFCSRLYNANNPAKASPQPQTRSWWARKVDSFVPGGRYVHYVANPFGGGAPALHGPGRKEKEWERHIPDPYSTKPLGSRESNAWISTPQGRPPRSSPTSPRKCWFVRSGGTKTEVPCGFSWPAAPPPPNSTVLPPPRITAGPQGATPVAGFANNDTAVTNSNGTAVAKSTPSSAPLPPKASVSQVAGPMGNGAVVPPAITYIQQPPEWWLHPPPWYYQQPLLPQPMSGLPAPSGSPSGSVSPPLPPLTAYPTSRNHSSASVSSGNLSSGEDSAVAAAEPPAGCWFVGGDGSKTQVPCSGGVYLTRAAAGRCWFVALDGTKIELPCSGAVSGGSAQPKSNIKPQTKPETKPQRKPESKSQGTGNGRPYTKATKAAAVGKLRVEVRQEEDKRFHAAESLDAESGDAHSGGADESESDERHVADSSNATTSHADGSDGLARMDSQDRHHDWQDRHHRHQSAHSHAGVANRVSGDAADAAEDAEDEEEVLEGGAAAGSKLRVIQSILHRLQLAKKRFIASATVHSQPQRHRDALKSASSFHPYASSLHPYVTEDRQMMDMGPPLAMNKAAKATGGGDAEVRDIAGELEAVLHGVSFGEAPELKRLQRGSLKDGNIF